MLPLRVAVFGCALPPWRFAELSAHDEGERIANQRFGSALLQALRDGGAAPVMIAAAPVTDFPRHSTFAFGRRRWREDDVTFIELPFVNVVGIKHVTRFAAAITDGWREVRAQHSEAIVVHGLPSYFLAAAALMGRFQSIPVVAVLTDPPNVKYPLDTRIAMLLKGVDSRLITALLRRVDGVVVVVPALAEDFAPGLPYLVMEGIAAAPTPPQRRARNESSRPLVLYAGGLREDYGVQLLLDAREHAARAFDVRICGRGPMSGALHQIAAVDPGVQFDGEVDSDELARAYGEADVLVNPRPLDARFVPYSFPSKVLEYLAAGRPVVSTRLPGIPEEYWQFVTACDDTAESLASAVMSAAARTNDVRALEQQVEFVRVNKTALPQGKRLVTFVRERVHTRTAA